MPDNWPPRHLNANNGTPVHSNADKSTLKINTEKLPNSNRRKLESRTWAEFTGWPVARSFGADRLNSGRDRNLCLPRTLRRGVASFLGALQWALKLFAAILPFRKVFAVSRALFAELPNRWSNISLLYRSDPSAPRSTAFANRAPVLTIPASCPPSPTLPGLLALPPPNPSCKGACGKSKPPENLS